MASIKINASDEVNDVPIWASVFLGLVTGTAVDDNALLNMGIFAVLITVVTLVWCWHSLRYRWHLLSYHTICIQFVAVCVGFFAGQHQPERPEPVDLSDFSGVQGKIYQVDQRNGRTRFEAKVDGITDVHGYAAPGQSLSSGTMVWLVGPFTSRQHSPNFKSEVGQVKWTCHRAPYVLSRPSYGDLSESLRLQIHRQISRIRHYKARQVLMAITLGTKHGMSTDLRKTFSAVGAQHLLAVSGLHIVGISAVILSLLILVASWRRVTKPLHLALGITLCLALLLLSICRFPVGGVRAFTMFLLFGVGKYVGRSTSTLESLFFAGAVMVIFDPDAWKDVGFLLSFGAVLGIVTQSYGGNVLHQLWQASLWSSVVTAPISTYFFGEFSLLGPLANLLMVPFVTVIVMPLAWLGICLGDWWSTPMYLAGEASLFFIALCQQLEWYGCVSWTVGSAAWLWVSLCCFGFWLWRRYRIPALVSCLSGVVLAGLPQAPSIDFVAVGQGDATLVSHRGQFALVDAGPQSSGRQLSKTLKKLGVSHLDVLVITHGHADHYMGLTHLLTQYHIARVVWNGRHITNPQLKRLRAQSENRGTVWSSAKEEMFQIGDVHLRIIPSTGDITTSENNASIATHLEYADSRVLLTGDRELSGEVMLLDQVSTRYEALRGGHHGSKTSSNDVLLRRICPSHMVLSMGLNNRFGFPDREVIQRTNTRKIRLWRTDRDGRISILWSDPPTISAVTQPQKHLLSTPRHPASTHCFR